MFRSIIKWLVTLLPFAWRRAIYTRYYRLNPDLPGEGKHASFAPLIQHRTIFIHIPKCAGISLQQSLFGKGQLFVGHVSIQEYRNVFSRADIESYFKFTFVRNPWDRLVSAFHFMKKGGMNPWDQEWSRTHLSGFEDFGDFVARWVNPVNIRKGKHFRLQADYVCLKGSRQHCMDFVGRFESIARDFGIVAEKLGIQASLGSTNVNADRRRDFQSYYDDRSRAIVAEVYREDIEMFGYDFDNKGLA